MIIKEGFDKLSDFFLFHFAGDKHDNEYCSTQYRDRRRRNQIDFNPKVEGINTLVPGITPAGQEAQS